MVNSEPEYRAVDIEAKTLTEFCDKADEVKKEWQAEGWEIMLDADIAHILDEDGMYRGIIRAVWYSQGQ